MAPRSSAIVRFGTMRTPSIMAPFTPSIVIRSSTPSAAR
jgi:hypothetical protein